ncbi:MAG: hypothetical protein H0U23_11925 [Blastocatellia bacterium]|jgi:hypothetical protein|nr:hypothetical protein [Blastocatellia bacterium]
MFVDLHDGYLNGLLIEAETTLILHCKTEDGRACTFTMPGMVRLRANNFREGNIIFELNIYQGPECPIELVKQLKEYEEARTDEMLSKDMEIIVQGNWTLVELTSSYGCDLLALFDCPAAAARYDVPDVRIKSASSPKAAITPER